MVKHRSLCHNNNYKRTSRKSDRYEDKKARKQYQKNKEKIEKSSKVKNVPRRSMMFRKIRDVKGFNCVCPEFLERVQKRVRIGGVGTMRRKTRMTCSYKYELSSKKESIKQTPLPHPSNYPKGECVVCFEESKMNKENTIKCYKVTHLLCKKCKDKLKKDVCPLCNSHSIGITIHAARSRGRAVSPLPRAASGPPVPRTARAGGGRAPDPSQFERDQGWLEIFNMLNYYMRREPPIHNAYMLREQIV